MNDASIVPIQIASNRRHREGLPDGWKRLFDGLVRQLATLDPVPTIDVADQRFGKLRIGLVRPDERTAKMVAQAVEAASTACDRCGNAGTLRRTPDAEWARRCSVHADMPAQFPTSERLQMIKQVLET